MFLGNMFWEKLPSVSSEFYAGNKLTSPTVQVKWKMNSVSWIVGSVINYFNGFFQTYYKAYSSCLAFTFIDASVLLTQLCKHRYPIFLLFFSHLYSIIAFCIISVLNIMMLKKFRVQASKHGKSVNNTNLTAIMSLVCIVFVVTTLPGQNEYGNAFYISISQDTCYQSKQYYYYNIIESIYHKT